MLRIKEKTKTIITQDWAKITPNKTNLAGETRIRVTRTPKGTITINAKGGTTTTAFDQTYLVLFVVSMAITLTISPKLSTSNG
jgi:hypothetical protein